MKQGLVRLLYNFYKRFMGWTLHMIMCVLLCYPVSIHMSQLLSTGHPISSCLSKRQQTPGTALQQKIESNLEKSLGNTLLQQQMGSFQASMLEAFQSLRKELTTNKQAEVDQISASASEPGPSTSAVNLDLPPPRPRTTSHTEEMDVDYGPALPPRLGSDHASDQNSNASAEPSKKVLDRPKTLSLSQ